MQDKTTPTEELDQKPATDPLEATPVIDSDLAESEVTSTEQPDALDISNHPTVPLTPLTPQKRYFQLNWWSVVALVLLLILIGEHTAPLVWPLIDNFLHPKATITIFSTQKQMSKTYSYLVVTGTADPGQNQIPARLLSFISPQQSATINTTGVGYTPAIKATGSITFYNEAPYVQTIQTGTVITGANNIQIVTDQTVTIAAGNGTTNGSASAPAHTIQAGERANIQPFAINTLCCLSGILARNTSQFYGGQDSKPYPMLSQTDVKKETAILATSLDLISHQGIQEQIKPTEQLLQPAQCKLTITTNPRVGEQATMASVSVFETCNSQVYDNSLMQSLTQQAFSEDAQREDGSNFIQRGTLAIALANTRLLDKAHQTYQLEVSATGTLIFHLTAQQLQSLKTQIAGKRIAEAQHELLQFEGIAGVYIQPAHQGDSQLPADPGQIVIAVS